MGDTARLSPGALRPALAAALLAVVACATAAPPPPARPAAPRVTTGVERYLPFQDATVFAYDTESPMTGERGMLVLEVRRPRSNLVELVVAGRARRLEVDASGFRHATGGWLLKEPLAQGATFQGDFGTVTITHLDRSVQVPAGSFEHCLETTESQTGADFAKQTVTVYCPNVGIVTRVTEVESNEGSGSETLRLKSFGPRVEL